jgi:16S rRNA C967 or C1407 C5-methylase (RsmB/RsmF family)
MTLLQQKLLIYNSNEVMMDNIDKNKDVSYEYAVSKLPEFLPAMLEEEYGCEYAHKIISGFSYRRTSLRVNTIKSTAEEIRIALNSAGIDFEPVSWSNNAFVIKNAREKSLWDLDIYKQGKIYLQSLSSMFPPIVLMPKVSADILDMTAAPGGKTTEMAALSGNRAHITACEMSRVRSEKLKYNLNKQGATCVYVMVQDARRLDDFFSFDQILLDAPCSGSGTLDINNDKLKTVFTQRLIEKSVISQTALLKKAIKLLKTGGELVYSTCSVLSRENDGIIEKALLDKRVEIIPIKFSGIDQIPLLPVKIAGTICVCPDKYYEGFYIAKLRKLS